MNRPMTPELSLFYVNERLSSLRHEAAVETLAHAIRESRCSEPQRPRIQRALGLALIGLGRVLAGEPAR